jgi:Uma2 family endonuclease
VVITEVGWRMGDDTVVRLDVHITCDPLPSQHVERPPVFVAEVVSPSTEETDRTAKRSL